jgi:DNA-binding transcriptional ArsR family regulator
MMNETKADLILHPVRWRIIQALARTNLTPQEISVRLPQVPQATLYRHLNKLAAAGLVVITEERPVRGTVEKVYALSGDGLNLSQADLEHSTREEHMRYFGSFLATLLEDYSRYLQRDRINLLEDGVGYHQAQLYLTDAEFIEFLQALNAAVIRFTELGREEGRQMRLFTTIVMPGAGAGNQDAPSTTPNGSEQP